MAASFSGTTLYAKPMRIAAASVSSQTVSFDVVLPLRDKAGLEALLRRQQDKTSADYHQWLTPAEFATRFGPDAAQVAKASAALRGRGLTVVQEGRILRVSGTGDAAGKMLGTHLAMGRTANGRLRAFASGGMVLPDSLRQSGAIVLGLDRDAHEAHPFSHRVAMAKGMVDPQNRKSATGGYWYGDLKQAYQYPSYQTMITKNGVSQRLDGTGATIGILMSGDVLDSDVDAVFNHENFIKNSGQAKNPALNKRVMINGGSTTSSGGFDEASLDVQESLTGAPGSHVNLYEIPDLSDDNIIAGYNRIITDNEADVVSSSFGGCELDYTAKYNGGTSYLSILNTEHEIFEQGNAQGITFLASSGDEAGLECPSVNYVVNGQAGTWVKGVSTPAADPSVTAVGGTNVVTVSKSSSLDSAYVGENAYGDPMEAEDPYGEGADLTGGYWGAGGGVSAVYAKPDYQVQSPVNTGSVVHRALPDIGMQVGGCPYGAVTPCNGGNSPLNGNGNTQRSYVIVAVGGQFYGLIGTSVSSPEFAGAVALMIEMKGRQGNLNPYLYNLNTVQSVVGDSPKLPTTVYHRHLQGYNGVVTTKTPNQVLGNSFNYAAGNGTPIVYRLIGAGWAKPAGLPQSASNP